MKRICFLSASSWTVPLGAIVIVICLAVPQVAAQSPRWSVLLGSRAGPGFISPAVGDIDANPNNGEEIVVATKNGIISAFSASGVLRWRVSVPSAACAGLDQSDRLHSSPSIGVLRRGDSPSVVIGYGSMGQRGCTGGVIAFNGVDGHERWRFDIQRHSARERYSAFRYGIVGAPAISKFFEGNRALVAVGSLSHYVYLLLGNGTLRYYYQAADTIFSSPSFFTDSRNRRVFAIGQDISKNTRLRPPTRNGGYLDLFAIKRLPNGKLDTFRSVDSSGRSGLIGLRSFDQTIASSPAIGDVAPNAVGPEIALTTGCFFPQNSSPKRGNYVTLTNETSKRILGKRTLSSCSATTPVLFGAQKMIVVLDNGISRNGGPGDAQIIGLRVVPTGSSVRLDTAWTHPAPTVTEWQSPRQVIFSNGDPGVVFHAGRQIRFYRAVDGTARGSFTLDGSINNASLAVGDIDGNGDSEVVAVMDIEGDTRVVVIDAP